LRRLLPFLLLAAPAAAQEPRPALSPTRDAAVTYRVTGPAGTAEGDTLRIAWLAAERKQRMDAAPGLWTVIERNTGTGLRVDDGARTVLRVPLSPAVLAQFEPAPDAALTRGPEARIAGLPCTEWSYRSPEGSGRLCVTPEGVPLRMETTAGGGPTRAEATEVRLAPQDPARFQIPRGYQVREAVPPRGAPRR
jgi:hypothetical protein